MSPALPLRPHTSTRVMAMMSQRYNNHSIVAFLESIGADFGACQNAYTNTDETVFELVVPAQPTSLLERTLTVMSEFAFGIRYAAYPM
eukprot:366000-Chlamydomonas_euryale.AAC.46